MRTWWCAPTQTEVGEGPLCTPFLCSHIDVVLALYFHPTGNFPDRLCKWWVRNPVMYYVPVYQTYTSLSGQRAPSICMYRKGWQFMISERDTKNASKESRTHPSGFSGSRQIVGPIWSCNQDHGQLPSISFGLNVRVSYVSLTNHITIYIPYIYCTQRFSAGGLYTYVYTYSIYPI
jgi:hypothetical protein